MAHFSLTDAAFEGFRITRERPLTVLGWIVAYFVFSLGIAMLATSWGVGRDLALLKGLAQAANPDVNAMSAVMSRIAPYVFLAVPLNILFFAILTCGILRAVLRSFERGLDYLKLGTDELRMILLAFVFAMINLVALFPVILISGLAAAMIGVFGAAAGAFASLLVFLALSCVTMWVVVRLSLAAAMTFDERRLIIFGSWSFTRGQFWPLFGAYLIAAAFCMLVWILLALIFDLTFQAIGGTVEMLNSAEFGTSISAFLTPPVLLAQGFKAAMVVAGYVIVLSPSAIAYLGLAGRTETKAFA